eukprot:scaffold1874_cov89-Skeletonema_dohrnii-CCMP3373.AAC.9
MNEDNNQADTCCASCGMAEIDDIKLKECAACGLVKYCCDECKQDHKSHHEEDCNKRAAELRDELLFKQPESSYLGDCPICCLPMPFDAKKSIMYHCCSKVICDGCDHANRMREIRGKLKFKCPFCRKLTVETDEERDKRWMKRIEANDPAAMNQKGAQQYNKGDYSSAFEHLTKAAELGNVEAHYGLAGMYRDGHGVEKNEKKEIHHFEEAAIGGHPTARCNLGCHEWDNCNIERAVKHWIIAANQGSDESIKLLMAAYRSGMISKEDLATTLRAHQAAVDASKSPQREAAEEYRRKWSIVEQK